ncbi:alpha-amylase family glycosyl hydrolase [uncultured Psychroserpens sp.]|uniref:alpha-amylase family glycosyl hydrolase n=1 Tax=uncultured Psychroserpens sp. TaxID=255436 RepID=UPI002626C242|nr:alpha-amylase family glycosyl hydrolase [uncultured Psychroserpens sp.]
MNRIIVIIIAVLTMACKENKSNFNTFEKPDNKEVTTPFVWEGANLYFLLTDRFKNGDTSNDINFDRNQETGKLRGFEGGDLKGITQKIEEGYFTDLGINAIWMTPIVEQIHGGTNEGTGITYGFHGYWTKDWTALDPNYGTKEDLRALIKSAHKKGIRVVLDAVINHTGPVTNKDSVWPEEWVRTSPKCKFDNYENTVACTLVENLPDVKTESDEVVELPPQLVEKWKAEGRYEEEVGELDAFFEKTGHPRSPRFYIMKWLTDYITEFGIDGYRVDTVKHTESYVWQEFKTLCDTSFSEWKNNNPEKVLDDNDFYLVGEVYNYNISAGKAFDYGDKVVNYFDSAFHSLINFEFKYNAAQQTYEAFFKRYNDLLNDNLKDYGTLNYLSSHDDGKPYDPKREKPFETATKLLLAPGTSQIYYGDESARVLVVEDATGDANLRSNMNWDAIENDAQTQAILTHWQKLGKFRERHPAVGAGYHQMITETPYLFYRSFSTEHFKDLVVIGLSLDKGVKTLDVSNLYENGIVLHDAYSNQDITVSDGKAIVNSEFDIVLLEQK